MSIEESLIIYKRNMGLGPLSSKFYDFVVDYLGLQDLDTKTPLSNAFDPWFGPSNDKIRSDDLTQYLDSRLHQKYRIALEFCAIEAGLEGIVGYVEARNRLRPATMLRFWFYGHHPHPVRWILRGGGDQRNQILTEGEEKQGSINGDTLEHWLEGRITQFRSLNYGEPK